VRVIALVVSACSVRVLVTDQGGGVPENFRDRIFKKFSQADSSDTRAKGGTGLGLAISKVIIQQMHGEIGFYNLPLSRAAVLIFTLICRLWRRRNRLYQT
jgi:signal transduction histidine kinase